MGRTGTQTAFSSVDRALILLTRVAPEAVELAEIKSVLAASPDWDEFSRKIRHNDIGPQVYLNLQACQCLDLLPEEVRRDLADRYATVRARNEKRWQRAAELFAEFGRRQIPVIVLKGGLFAENLYGDVGYKKMNDIDILIRWSDLPVIKELYETQGLVPLALLEDGKDDGPEEKGYHLPAYVSKDVQFVLGTHWNLCNPKHGWLFQPALLWEKAVPVEVAGQAVFSLAPRDVLHHLIVHFHYYKTGLKELADIANWLRVNDDDPDWGLMRQEIDAARTWTPAFRVLSLVKTLYGGGVPDDVLQHCRDRADPWVVQDTEHLVSRRDVLLMSRSTWSSEIEKAYLAFAFESEFARKLPWYLTFWRRLLFPPGEVLCRVSAAAPGEKSWFRLWVMNLVRTAREIGKSFGVLIFLILMVKSTGELLLSLSGGGSDRMAELRRLIGADDAEIRRLMDSMD